MLIHISSRLSVNPDCVSAFNELKLGGTRGGPKYIIYKISDDQKEIVVDEIGKETDYDVFREKLVAKKEKGGKDRPSYAIYDVEFELEGGEGKRCVGQTNVCITVLT
jgi:cofilin